MITRRRFFKRLGMIAGCAVIAPKVSLERLERPDFVPGQRLRNAVRYPNDLIAQRDFIAKNKLENWLKSEIPVGFRHGKKPGFRTKLFDYYSQKGMAISYYSPKSYKL